MQRLKAIVVEDEVNVREGFIKLINTFVDNVDVIGTADTVVSACELIDRSGFDILFLDINLPDGTGFDVIHRAKNTAYHIIFVTAYDNYAIEAFKVSAIDYLLKPVAPHQLTEALSKISKDQHTSQTVFLDNLKSNITKPKNQTNKIVLKDQDSMSLVAIETILYCQAEGSYTKFTLSDGRKIYTSLNLKEYESLLTPYAFNRCHHSYLVNLHQIVEVNKHEGGYLVMTDGVQVPVSTRKKSSLLEAIKDLFVS